MDLLGLPGLDNISAEQLQAVFDAIVASANATGNNTASGGNIYQIDLRGATVRSDDDIDMIVDRLEERMRSAER